MTRHGPLGVAVPETNDLDTPLWTGPVERRPAHTYQRQGHVGIVRCTTCRHWRALALVRCSACGVFTPLAPE